MPRFALVLSYDGAAFDGWQTQPSGRGAQDALETALAEIGERGRVTGAGRTDAGVHARAQVAHFDARRDWEPRRLTLALNAHLPDSISVMRASPVSPAFDARRSALSREYRYFIWNSPVCYPHIRPFVWWLKGPRLDWARAARAARLLEGEHDFRAFCRTVDAPENTRRTVLASRLSARGELVIFRVRATAFLTNMIRISIGNLAQIASGRRDESWLASLLSGGGGREKSARTAPAGGLFFWRAFYPETV